MSYMPFTPNRSARISRMHQENIIAVPEFTDTLSSISKDLLAHNVGLSLLTGPFGVGKSLLCRQLAQFPPKGWTVIPTSSKRLNLAAIEQQVRDNQQHDLVIVDDAQHLGEKALSNLMVLAQQSPAHGHRLHVLLIGRPRLVSLLGNYKSRIHNHYHLAALASDSAEHYLHIRLKQNGMEMREWFTQSAIDYLHQYSFGSAGLLNIYCQQALHDARQQQRKHIDLAAAQTSIEALNDYAMAPWPVRWLKRHIPGGRGGITSNRLNTAVA